MAGSDYGPIHKNKLRAGGKEMMKNMKMGLIVAAGIMAVIIMCFLGVQSTKNKAISLEEAVETAKSDIKVQEKKRVDLVYNLADCVKEYDKHEAEVLHSIASGRNQNADIENVSTSIKVVAEAYPDLKSSEQYQTLMLELTTIENEISQYRTAYNKAVERYNRYTRKTITEIFLNWTGYEKQKYERLNYDTPADAPQNLFGEE